MSDPENTLVMELEGGAVTITLRPDLAPNHVARIKALTREGFYDGLTFHRIINDFMIQGGDPYSKNDDPPDVGMGGPGRAIEDEFSDVAHLRGVVSMANKGYPNSGGSQFFIVIKDSNFLDGKYAAFARVTEGIEVADAIAAVERDPRDRPLENVRLTRVNVVEALARKDTYDLVLVIMRKNHALQILPILAENQGTPNVLFLMNNGAGPKQLVDALGKERVLIGFADRFCVIDNHLNFVSSHLLGARGAEFHVPNFWPDWSIRFWQLLEEGNYVEAQGEFARVIVPFHAMWAEMQQITAGDGYLDKLCMELVGLPASRCRPPTRDVRDQFRDRARRMLVEFGVPGLA